eukprot:CAMPEP_0180023094 /NCGR_PEP_ID=MMETSP0984-20121128/23235_1 /TAXON_ID=483367 /ORGANISM="non described non described, Strain CCMP 2436" /LENGTH=122 /DNA_ID=CAMNT_0021947229 /DNA_START=67 /DNA_END=431 /DNA_ORIENTATION=-
MTPKQGGMPKRQHLAITSPRTKARHPTDGLAHVRPPPESIKLWALSPVAGCALPSLVAASGRRPSLPPRPFLPLAPGGGFGAVGGTAGFGGFGARLGGMSEGHLAAWRPRHHTTACITAGAA